ncbi:MAG TPA: phosphatase PAP2 family protein [Kofleriaceae bacterium]|nr:phosphatase PAP2 family protein [Kofleriaceae bacterium]
MSLPRPALRTTTVIALLFAAATTRADPAATDTAPPAATPDSAPIAPPAPDAPPAKVEEAKKIAQTAALTPIVPTRRPAAPVPVRRSERARRLQGAARHPQRRRRQPSFLSSHTAEAFAMVTALYVAEHRLHPRSSRPKYLLAVGLGVASLIGVARVMSGYHFITDTVGGAVVGSSVGVLVASIHSSPVHVVPVIDHRPEGSTAGVALSGGF